MPLIVKVKCGDETRRRRVDDAVCEMLSHSDLVSIVADLLPEQDAKRMQLRYTDDDGDLITLVSDADVKEALALAREVDGDNPVLRMVATFSAPAPAASNNKPVALLPLLSVRANGPSSSMKKKNDDDEKEKEEEEEDKKEKEKEGEMKEENEEEEEEKEEEEKEENPMAPVMELVDGIMGWFSATNSESQKQLEQHQHALAVVVNNLLDSIKENAAAQDPRTQEEVQALINTAVSSLNENSVRVQETIAANVPYYKEAGDKLNELAQHEKVVEAGKVLDGVMAKADGALNDAAAEAEKWRKVAEELFATHLLDSQEKVQAVIAWMKQAPEGVQDSFMEVVAEAKKMLDECAMLKDLAATLNCNNNNGGVRHSATCDGCEKAIVGVRYKCLNCIDYDLCVKCEATNNDRETAGRIHDTSHVFAKVYKPLPGLWRLPAIQLPNLYQFGYSFGGGGAAAGASGNNSNPNAVRSNSNSNVPRRRRHGGFGGRCGGGHGSGWRARHKLEARYVRQSIVDGSVVLPDSKQVNTFTIRNSGKAAWPKGCHLALVGGDNLVMKDVELESLAEVAVDEEVDLSIPIHAPVKDGRYVSYFRMTSPGGERFGQRLWVDILVRAPLPPSSVDHDDDVVEDEEKEEALKEVDEDDFLHIEKSAVEVQVEEKEKDAEEKDAEEAVEEGGAFAMVIPVEYKEQVEQLNNMGFDNDEINVPLLQSHRGNLLDAVADLLHQRK